VGHGTFYLYFESKEEIFRELVRHLSHELRSTIARAVEGIDDRLEVERVGFRTFFRFVGEHRNLYHIINEADSVDPELSRWYYERIGRGYTEGLREAMDEGQIRRLNPEALAYALAGMGHMLGVRWVLWEEREPPEDWLETLVSFLRHGLLPGDGRGARAYGADDRGEEG
jgi:AcrR family transcriptional regulator